MRNRSLIIAASCLALIGAGCQQQMADQPAYRPLEASSFFANGQSARDLVPGTVARGHLEIDQHFYTGRKPGANRKEETARTENPLPVGKNVAGKTSSLAESQFVDTFPFPVTLEVLEHGRDRFMIYCVVCHDPMGTGRGKIVERGLHASAVVSHTAAPQRPGGTHLRRDQRGIRFDALLRRSDLAA